MKTKPKVFVSEKESICIRCRGAKLLCGKKRCPVLLKYYKSIEIKPFIEKKIIYGSSPPSVFVGRVGYPKVYAGPMLPPFGGDTSLMDTPEMWYGKSIDEIVDFRMKLIRGKSAVNVFDKDKIVSYLHEIAMANKPVDMEVDEFSKEKEIAEKYKVDKIPATLLFGKREYGIRFFGIPSGYEFSALIEDIISVSRGRSNLKEETKEELRKIDKRIHLQVFVTPTCPYCPSMTHLAHQMAIENENIIADMVEIAEFPHLAHKYNVMGVPKTVINEKIEIVGSVREEYLLGQIKKALSI